MKMLAEGAISSALDSVCTSIAAFGGPGVIAVVDAIGRENEGGHRPCDLTGLPAVGVISELSNDDEAS